MIRLYWGCSMRSLSLAVCGLLLAGPGFAQSPNWLNARTIEIDMKNFAFVPATITLQRGVPYRLRFVNTAGGGHNFVAKAFSSKPVLPLPAGRRSTRVRSIWEAEKAGTCAWLSTGSEPTTCIVRTSCTRFSA